MKPPQSLSQSVDLRSDAQELFDVVKFALHNATTASSFYPPRILAEARNALLKYRLSEPNLEIASEALAHTMCNHLEQWGTTKLPEGLMVRIEQEVLALYGFFPNNCVIKTMQRVP